MEKEIGSETEMEEGTGGLRKGGNRRKEMSENSSDRKQSRVNVCLFSPFGHLFPFSKFTQYPLQRQGQS